MKTLIFFNRISKVLFIARGWIVVLNLLLVFCTNLHAQWVQKNNGLYGGDVTALAINGASAFAGTSHGGGVGVYHGRIFRSNDNGVSWTPVSNGLPNASINALVASGGVLYTATDGGGVGVSTDNGANWIFTNTGLTDLDVLSLAVSSTNIFAGTSSGGVFLSTDNGASWTPVNNGLTNMEIHSLAVVGSNIFAGTYGYVFLSTDNGNTWTNVSTGIASYYVIYSLAAIGGTLLAGTDQNGVLQSTDNGGHWTPSNSGILLPLPAVTALITIGTNVFAGTSYAGVFVSGDGGDTWSATNNGFTNNNVNALAGHVSNIFAGTGNGVFESADNGANWTTASIGITDGNVYSIEQVGANLFASTYGGGIFRSSDNAASWTTANTGLPSLYVPGLVSSGANLFAGTASGVARSTDNGDNWTAVNNGLTETFILYRSTLAVSGSNLFVGTWGGGVSVSTDNGDNWTPVNSGLGNLNICSVSAINGKLYAGTNGGTYVSTDDGASWNSLTSGLPVNANIRAMVISGTTIFAGDYATGVYLSFDDGASWSIANTGITDVNIESFALNGTDVVAATYGGGIFRSTDNGANWAAVNTGLTNNYVRCIKLTGSDFLLGTDGSGVWGRSADLVILSNVIVFNSQPSDKNVCEGTTIQFSTDASGAPNLVYQWQFSSSASGPFSDLNDGGGYSGATTKLLSVNTTSNLGAGNYRCKVNGDLAATAYSQVAKLTIINNCNPPVIASITLTTPPESKISVDLASQITTSSASLDLNSITVSAPQSQATTSIDQGVLTIDYAGTSFVGTERLTIGACDLNANCATQVLTINVVGEVVVYNAFSPNGDDKNEFFFLQYIDMIPDTKSNRVRIYNRWGDEVFETTDYNNTTSVFKGLNKSGSELTTGTYFYKIDFTGGKASMKGTVTIKR